jgi:hypothetical protein
MPTPKKSSRPWMPTKLGLYDTPKRVGWLLACDGGINARRGEAMLALMEPADQIAALEHRDRCLSIFAKDGQGVTI